VEVFDPASTRDSGLLQSQSQSQSESYVTTDGQTASVFWCQAPIWGLRPDIRYCQTVVGMLVWGALFNGRTGQPFKIAAGPRQCSHSCDHILLSLIRDPQPVESRPLFIFPSKIQSQNQSYIAFDGRSISKSWYRAPSGAPGQIFNIV
jgi:hypothetical protein